MKKLINEETNKYYNEGINFFTEADNVLMPLFKKWVDEGYSIFEIELLLYQQVSECAIKTRMDFNRKQDTKLPLGEIK